MASRRAAAAAADFRALRSTGGRLSRRGGGVSSSSSPSSRSSSLLAPRPLLLDDHQSLLLQQRSSSTLLVHCHSRAFSSSPSTLSRLFSANAAAAAAAPVSSKVLLVKDDAQYAEIMKDIKSKDTLAVVYFTAQWCGPCKQIAPYIDQLSQQFDDVTFFKIDVDKLEVEQTMINSRIGVVPTFHFHKKGELIGELTGAVKDKLKNLVETLRSKS